MRRLSLWLACGLFVSCTAEKGPARIEVVPSNIRIVAAGGTGRLVAVVYGSENENITGLPIAWSSSDPAVVTVSSEGVLTGGEKGHATVTATIGSVSGKAEVTVDATRCVRPPATVAPSLPVRVPATFAANRVNTASNFGAVRGAAVDLDGDGTEEIITWAFPAEPRFAGEARAWRAEADAGFSEITTSVFPSPLVVDWPRRVIREDFNHDGRMDIYVAQTGIDDGTCAPGNPCPGAPDVLLMQSSMGTLVNAAPSMFHPYEDNAYTHGAAVADVNCDGYPDIFQARWPNPAKPQTHLLMNDGGIGFEVGDATRLPKSISKTTPFPSAAFCDVNADGAPDLVLGAEKERSQLLLNDGFGVFLPPTPLPETTLIPTGGATVLDISCIDYDQDGLNDLAMLATNVTAVRGYDEAAVHLFHNSGAGQFVDVSANAVPQTFVDPGCAFYQLGSFDLNRDGWPDLIAHGCDGRFLDTAHFFTNQGDGGFVETTLIPTVPFTAWWVPAALGADGGLSFYVGGMNSSFVVVPE